MAHEPPPVDALMELLSRMRAESERNAAAIEALEKAHADGAGRLAHRFEAIKRLEAEVEEIECKSLDSAGNARASSEVLAAEQRCAPSAYPHTSVPSHLFTVCVLFAWQGARDA